jgi:hypothetical protein
MKHRIAVVLLISIAVLATGCSGVTNLLSNNQVATVKDISVSILGSLSVEIQPTDNAVIDRLYVVNLYEKGEERASKYITFNQPQINIHDTVDIEFPLTHDEYESYFMKDVTGIFSVKVIDMLTSTHPPTTSKR